MPPPGPPARPPAPGAAALPAFPCVYWRFDSCSPLRKVEESLNSSGPCARRSLPGPAANYPRNPREGLLGLLLFLFLRLAQQLVELLLLIGGQQLLDRVDAVRTTGRAAGGLALHLLVLFVLVVVVDAKHRLLLRL